MKTHPYVDPSIVRKLAFIEGSHLLWSMGRKPTRYTRSAIFSVSEKTFDMIEKLFAGKDATLEGKKVYKLPNCSIEGKKVGDICKKNGATLTEDPTLATLFLGNLNVSCVAGNTIVPDDKTLLFKHYLLNTGACDTERLIGDRRLKTMIEDEDSFKMLEGLTHTELCSEVFFHFTAELGIKTPSYFLTPLAVKLIFEMASRKVPVMDEDSFLMLSERIKLTEREFDKLRDLILNEKDRKLAFEMLWEMDTTDSESILWLWKLARDEEVGKLVVAHTGRKQHQLFLDKSGLKSLRGMTLVQFMQMCEKEGCLTDSHREVSKGMIQEEITGLMLQLTNCPSLKQCYEITLVPKVGFMEQIKL